MIARPELPQAVGFIVFAAPEVLKATLEKRGDSTVAKGRWWRVGGGQASVKVSDARGHTLRGVECGGVLFVEARPGPCTLAVRNETRTVAQVLVSANGRDPLTGAVASWEQPGPLLSAGSAKRWPSFPIMSIASPRAMQRADLAAQPGVVRVALFSSADGTRPVVHSPARPYRY